MKLEFGDYAENSISIIRDRDENLVTLKLFDNEIELSEKQAQEISRCLMAATEEFETRLTTFRSVVYKRVSEDEWKSIWLETDKEFPSSKDVKRKKIE